MSIYDDLSYTYPREIIIALIITAIVFWFGLRMTRKAERRFQRTRATTLPEHKTSTTEEHDPAADREKVLSATATESEQ